MIQNYFRIATLVVAISFLRPTISAAYELTSGTKKETTEKPSGEYPFAKKEKAPATGSANLKEINKHSFGLGVGQTFLLGDFADHGEDKITGDFLYSYSASYSFDLLIDAHSSTHTYRGEKVLTRGVSASVKSHLLEFDAFSPYVLGGLGFYWPQMVRNINGQSVTSDTKTAFGVNFGGGVDLRLNSRFTFGILGQFHKPFKIKQETQPSVDGAYFKLLLTGMYTY